MHTVNEAIAVITEQAQPLSPRTVPLSEALGGLLDQAIIMDIDSPPFDRAMVDGYAARAVDALAGAQLRVVGRIDAGSAAGEISIGQGQCVGINTGAPVPPGADVVIMVEHTAPVAGHADFVQITKMPAGNQGPGSNGIQPRGTDARNGDIVLPAGVRLGAKELAIAGAAGRGQIHIHAGRPRVAVLVTGDELVPVEERPGPAQIRNTNRILLLGLLAERGLPALDLGTLRDEPGALRAALERGLAEADLLLVTGGMSMGTKDWVPRLLAELGVHIHVEKVRMKPGKPFVFGTVEFRGGRRYVAGLPGNPVSAFVCFIRFVVPLLRRLGAVFPASELLPARAGADLPLNGDREFYQPCTLAGNIATPTAWRGSADLFTLAHANALLIHPAGAPARAQGSPVEVLPIGGA